MLLLLLLALLPNSIIVVQYLAYWNGDKDQQQPGRKRE